MAVVDVGKLLLLAPTSCPEIVLPTESDRDETPLLCSASDLDALPYVLTPGTECAGLEQIWGKKTN